MMTTGPRRFRGRHVAATLAAIGVALIAPAATGPATARAEQGGIGDLFKGLGDAGKIINMVIGGAKVLESLGMAEDQQVQTAYGEAIAVGTLSRYPLTKDEALNKYVTMVGLVLVEKTSNPSYEFQFGVLETPEVNAFATPHGVVLITRGALRMMEDESELAGVLAHEITHVVKRHGMQSVANAKFTEGALQAGMAAAGSRAQAEFGAVADAGVDAIVLKGYDQGTEREADREAVALAKATWYDPSGLRRFLERLESRGQADRARLFGTHPGRPERIKLLKQIDGGGGKRMAERYREQVK